MKVVLDSKKWDSDRWDGWGIILGSIPHFFRDVWSRQTSETLFLVVIFSILDLGRKNSMVSPSVRKNNSGTTTPGTASKRLMPTHYTKLQKLLKLCDKLPTYFQTLTFCRNLGFQKPWIRPWIFHELSGPIGPKTEKY